MTRNERIFFAAFAALAAAGVIAGLIAMEPPWVARKRAIDAHRQRDLVALASAVNRYKARRKELPGDLSALDAAASGDLARNDPETGAAYEYSPTSGETYELCATFDVATLGNEVGDRTGMWRRRAGRQCYEFRDSPFAPTPK